MMFHQVDRIWIFLGIDRKRCASQTLVGGNRDFVLPGGKQTRNLFAATDRRRQRSISRWLSGCCLVWADAIF